MDDCSNETALTLFEEGRYPESNSILFQLIESEEPDPMRCFWIGRNFFRLGELSLARTWLTRSVEASPPVWAYYILARVELETGNILAAGDSLLCFLERFKSRSEATNIPAWLQSVSLEIADAVFHENPVLAFKIYKAADAVGIADYESGLRIVDAHLGASAIEEAAKAMQSLRTRFILNASGMLALAAVLWMQGNEDGALEAMQNVLENKSRDFEELTRGNSRFIEIGAAGLAQKILDGLWLHSDQTTAGETATLLRQEMLLASRNRDTGRISRILAYNSFSGAGECIDPGILAELEQLAQFVEEHFSAKVTEVAGLLRFFTRTRNWDAATRFLEEINQESVLTDPAVLVPLLDFYCVRGDNAAAASIYDLHFKNRELSVGEHSIAIRYLAHSRRWNEAAGHVTRLMDNRMQLPVRSAILLRIARLAKKRRHFLDILDAAAARQDAVLPPDAVIFRQMLIDDLCREARVSSLENREVKGSRHLVSRRNRVLLGKVGDGPVELPPGIVLCVCSDKTYFFGALTLLTSYAAHNNVAFSNIPVFVFLSNDVPKSWERALHAMATKIGLGVKTVREADFLPAGAASHAEWGFFNAGKSLSNAAYFRMYAAKYLHRTGFQRICYIDSDIICNGDLGDLFTHDLCGNLMAAMIDEPTIEVSQAAAKNGLDLHSYVNSGVMVFDMSNKNTRKCLDRAIRIAEEEPSLLHFLDQDALNIAFAGRISFLNRANNSYIWPIGERNPDLTEARLLHFVGFPKPWDVSYDKEFRELWTPYAKLVRLLIDDEVFAEIVESSNSS